MAKEGPNWEALGVSKDQAIEVELLRELQATRERLAKLPDEWRSRFSGKSEMTLTDEACDSALRICADELEAALKDGN